MKEAPRKKTFQKSEKQEAEIQRLNTLLLGPQSILEQEATPGYSPPVIFILGMARSGTTLSSQLLASAGLAHVSNFVAKFWDSPAVGARIEKAVIQPQDKFRSSFESQYGVTTRLDEPHEFGYFWARFFDLGQETHNLSSDLRDKVDRYSLWANVTSLQRVYNRPLVFKNNTWCSLQADLLSEIFPDATFVVCRRDPIWIAQSIQRARIERYGDKESWWSIRPSTFVQLQSLPWYEQIARQVLDFELELNETLKNIQKNRIIPVEYKDLCANPNGLVERVIERLELIGVEHTMDTDALPAGFKSRDTQRLSDIDWTNLTDAIARFSS
jgi:hypothetical protein